MVNWNDYAAVLFDLDGVLTPTADVHMRAWERLFNSFLTEEGRQADYRDEDYYAHVDGKPRYEGVAAFLASRGLEMEYGSPSDAPEVRTVCGLGNRKNVEFERILASEGVSPYPGSLKLVEALSARKYPMAIVSSSRNAPLVLTAAGLIDYFDVIVDGRVAALEGIAGKPAPDMFQSAADRLGVPRTGCVVVEDAVSGVQAGAAGGFGLVIGVDRGAGAERLSKEGAQLVVKDLGELL